MLMDFYGSVRMFSALLTWGFVGCVHCSQLSGATTDNCVLLTVLGVLKIHQESEL